MEKEKHEFDWNKQENYTHEELLGILKDHTVYVAGDFKDYVSPEDFQSALKPYKEVEFDSKVKGFLPKNFKEQSYKDFMKLSEINMDDKDDDIKTKIKDALKTRDYFLEEDKKSTLPPEKEGKIEVKDEPEREYKFTSNWKD